MIIGHDMPPELAADVSTALAGDGRRRQGQRLRPTPTAHEQGHRRDLAQGRLRQDRRVVQPRGRPRPAPPGPGGRRRPRRPVRRPGDSPVAHPRAHAGAAGPQPARSTPPPSSCSSPPTSTGCTSWPAPTIRSTPTRSAMPTCRRCCRCWRRTSTTWSSTRRPASTSARWRPSSAPPTCCSSRASTSRASAACARRSTPSTRCGVKAARHFVLNRADAKVGLNPSDAEEAIGMKISCSIPSSREIPLSLNLGTPVVVSEPKSPVARQLQQLSAAVRPDARPARPKKGWRR